jgi:endogenous inhibitor of DNA gyrase (YacG/DUF329 family)
MKCPTCGKPVAWKDNPFRPFCSERCKLVDLGRWVSDEYSVPGKPVPPEQLDSPQSPPNSTDDN